MVDGLPARSPEGCSPRSNEVPPLVTGAASLGIVLGLFLLVVWVMAAALAINVSTSVAVATIGNGLTVIAGDEVKNFDQIKQIGRAHV